MDFTAVKKSPFFLKECNENKSKVGVEINVSLYKMYKRIFYNKRFIQLVISEGTDSLWMDLDAVKTFASMFKEP